MAKARTNLEDFQNIEIPLPSLTEQKAIVARWRKAQDEISAARECVEKRKAAINARLFADVGLRSPEQGSMPKAFAAWWKEVERWGVQFIYLNCQHISESKFRELLLSEVCKIGSGGTPHRSVKRYFGGPIPWVKTTEVRNEEIATTEESLTNEGLRNSSAKLYPKGSLLIAMYGQGATRGRTAKLAIDAATNQACAVLYNIAPCIKTDFLWYFLMSQYEAIRALASGNNQPNLNAEMIANLRIPLPPMNVQKQIMDRVAAGRKEIARERDAADRLARDIDAEVEALILGIKKMDEL
ncbi:MAG: restriction endonuclease subunit S, partial [Desulfobacterales bacterium]|nr:restriction endonuclease subunit S [Desulfobacterales bacterium]